jgi:hypothetical protein
MDEAHALFMFTSYWRQDMQEKKDLKYKIGMGFIALSLISPLIGLAVPLLDLSTGTTTALVTFFMVGGPEIFLIAGAALAGKQAIESIKKEFFQYAGKARYQFGLILFITTVFVNWVFVYINLLEDYAFDINTRLIVTICIDVTTIISIFVMGPEFFEKVKRLATWEGQTQE